MTLPNLPNTLQDIITKVRRITGRPSASQISDSEIVNYINTFYIYDMPEHLRLESLRVNYQFTTSANVPVYDFPTSLYLTAMPPVFMAGYLSYMTQSRENFFRINPELQFLQQQVATGNGTNNVPYTGTLSSLPILQGFKKNPPGAFSTATNNTRTSQINYNVIFSAVGAPNGTTGITPSFTLVDDGQGNLVDPQDPFIPGVSTSPPNYVVYGNINYITGAFTINNFVVNGTATAATVPSGNAINAQYTPYVPTRPQQCVFYQDQIILYPIPDQAYIVSFEAYTYPASFIASQTTATPQLQEWWQLLAYGAADKVFADNSDFENLTKFRPLLQEQLNLMQRRTIVQQTSERTATIYTEQNNANAQYPFGNLFSGF